ncbi:LytR C-terminal domain-containing protein [Desulfosediminicola sp.]|uniref:LytR C-terminal domain-containing protein n=1 Tax=Desulfosediminicola sp. TaxID=2886825 RepID=UPI003AF21DB5
MKHRKKAVKVALFFCVVPMFLEITSCSIHDTNSVNIWPWTKDVESLVGTKVNARFWSKVRPHSSLADAHLRLAGFYQKQGKYELAIDEYSKALKVDGRYCKAYNGIAMSYDGLKNCELAHKAYELAINCDPEEAYIYNNYGYSSILCNQLDEGIALLLKAEELSDGDEQIKNNLELARLALTRQTAPDYDILPEDTPGLNLANASPKDLPTYLATAAEEKEEQEKAAEQIVEAVKITEEELPDVPEPFEQPSVVLVPSAGAKFQPHLLVDGFESPEPEELTLPADTSVAAVNTGNVIKPVLKPGSKSAVPAQETVAEKRQAEKIESVATPTLEPKTGIVMPPIDPLVPAKDPEVQAKSPTLPEKAEVEDKSQALYQKTETGVEVSNGNGVTGMARRSSELFVDYGFKVRRITNARNFQFDDSVIYYRDGYFGVAEELSHFIPGDQKLEQVDSLGRAAIGVRVLLGNDMVMLDFPEHFTKLSYVQLEEGKPGVWKNLVTLTIDE